MTTTLYVILLAPIVSSILFILGLGVRELIKARRARNVKLAEAEGKRRAHRRNYFKAEIRDAVFKYFRMFNVMAGREPKVDEDQPLSLYFGAKSDVQYIWLRDWVYEQLCSAIQQAVMPRFGHDPHWHLATTIDWLWMVEYEFQNEAGGRVLQVEDFVQRLFEDMMPHVPGLSEE